MSERRFPPPWSIDELEACFVVIDSAGQKLAYVYFEDEQGTLLGAFSLADSDVMVARRFGRRGRKLAMSRVDKRKSSGKTDRSFLS